MPTRAIAALVLMTGIAAALLNAQARAMARTLELREQRAVHARAVAAAGEELTRATRAVEAGTSAIGVREIMAGEHRLRMATTTVALAGGTREVRVHVTDEEGAVLVEYRTAVERKQP